MKLIFVRHGLAVLLSEFGETPVAVGDVVVLGANTLCGSGPEGSITVTTLYLDRDYDRLDRRIDAHHGGDYADARAHLANALGLLTNCADIYQRGDDANRRLCNQAFFTKVCIDEDDELRVENNRPFVMLLDPEVNANALNWTQSSDKA